MRLGLSERSASRKLARNGALAYHCLAANDLALAGHPVSYCAGLRAPFFRSFAIRLMSFTGTGLVSVKWIVPFLTS